MKLRHIFGLFLIAVALFGWKGIKVNAAAEFYEDNDNGIVTITYNNDTKATLKVMVAKGTESYYYDMKDGENTLNIPLTMGNGKYTIRIVKNISGTKYSVIEAVTIELDLKDENEVFKYSNVIVNYEEKYEAVKKAATLTKKSKNDADKIKKVHEYVVKNFSYDNEKASSVKPGYVPDVQIVYENKKGICYDISAIMASMLRSQGIKIKLVTGYTPNIDGYHAWNSIYDTKTKKWYPVDATYDIGLYAGKKEYSLKKNVKDYSDVKFQY